MVGAPYLQSIKEKIKSGNTVVEVDPAYYRPSEVDLLIGNAGKARKELGWDPKYDLKGLIEDMMQSDVNLMKKESYLIEGGFRIMNYFE
jgi:GDPmannose 4,6-dehydratase